jgi:hypothetical protein
MRIMGVSTILLGSVLLLLGILIACTGPGPIVEGVVGHKAVTGVIESTSYTILTNWPGSDSRPWIRVKDSDFEEFFSKQDRDAVINKSVEDEMSLKYDPINYLVSIILTSQDTVNKLDIGDASMYFVSRDDFNKVKIDDEVRFEVSKSGFTTIERFLEAEN